MSDVKLFSHDAFPIAGSPETIPRFVPGTRLSTPDGPCGIEMLAVGDTVITRAGPMRIARLGKTRKSRADWTFDRSAWPVRIPVGSLGNSRPMRLSPDQRILLSGETLARICGVAEVSVPVRGLPAVVEAEGGPCEVDTGEATTLDRDLVRAAFQAMHAVGEPVMKR